MQYARLFQQCLNNNSENLKAWLYLVNFTSESHQDKLLKETVDQFQRTHPSFYLSWLLRAKVIEAQSSTVDARRVYAQSLAFIKQFDPSRGGEKFVTQRLNEDEVIQQTLPGDALKLFYNWAVMECSFVQQLTAGLTNLNGLEANMLLLIEGQMIRVLLLKAFHFVFKFDVRGDVSC